MGFKRAELIGMVYVCLLVSAGLLMATTGRLQAAVWMGPLTVHASNPRYFSDGSRKAIYLTGSHTWNNFQNRSDHPPLDYPTYLDWFQRYQHNFIRLWVWEQAAWAPWTTSKIVFSPLPYLRTGPGRALDGEPKFDLAKFNEEYFDRLRNRVSAAGDRGIYVSVMLFQGWSHKKLDKPGDPWPGHPFHKDNNINGINGDPNGDGNGWEVHTLRVPAITRLQEAYVRKVVDTLNDLDNVLYEISNESPAETKDWQYHMVNYIKKYEASQPKQHPVGMTYFGEGRIGTMDALYKSPADWISPGNDPSDAGATYRYGTDPPVADGSKVIISDTDHFYGVGGDADWVWKSFTRGLNPIFMDRIDDPRWESARRAMGHTLTYAKRMNLTTLIPRGDLCSTTYCLANPGFEYLIYLPFGSHWIEEWIELTPYRIESWIRSWVESMNLFGRTVLVDLSAASGTLSVEWFNPSTGETTAAGTVTGGANLDFTAPFSGAAVLYLSSGDF